MIVEFPSEGEKSNASHALLVDDDDVVVQVVGETLKSMGHTYDVAMNQEQAEKLLAEKAYDYFLLDLAIPLYPKGLVSKQYGRNLLLKIKEMPGHRDKPPLMITSHDLDTTTTAVDCMKIGAGNYVAKPIGPENPLADRIREALRNARNSTEAEPRPGEIPRLLAVTLISTGIALSYCGEKIAGPEGKSRPRMVLDLLKRRYLTSDKRNYDSRFIARELGFERGPDAVSDAVFQIRESCTEALRTGKDIRFGTNDVVSNQHRGYVFAPRIQVRDFSEGGEVHREDTEHQRAILRELGRGDSLSRSVLSTRLHLTVRALDQEMADLLERGDVMKEGNGAAMRFKLAKAPELEAG